MKESGLRLKKKLQSKAGETIAETLVTMIILSLAVLMLAGAVVTTARVNKQADNTDTSFQTRQTGAKVSTGTNSTKVILSEENATGDAGGCIKCGNSGAGISVPGKQSGKELYLL